MIWEKKKADGWIERSNTEVGGVKDEGQTAIKEEARNFTWKEKGCGGKEN